MSFPAYKDYVDSTINWLPKQPSQWRTKPVKAIATINDDTLSEAADPELEIEYVDIGSVSLENGIEKKEAMSFGESPSRARRLPREGDVLVSTVRTYLKAIAPVTSQTSNLVCSTGFAVIRPKPELEPGFLKYALQEEHFIQEVISRSTGVSYPAINASDIGRIKICLPCRGEQLTIASFLDRETAKIDALIAEQERLIELLQEKRQAFISHAVSKGLNPNAPMKDSGVEWLGEVPEHWAIRTIGYCCRKITYGFTNPMPTEDDGPYMLTANDINEGDISFQHCRRTGEKEFNKELTEKSKPMDGDILLTKDGTLGRCAVFRQQEIPACINQSVALIRIDPRQIKSDFLQSALSCARYQEKMLFDAGGTTIKHIYISRLSSMRSAIPPLDEQEQLSEVIHKENSYFLVLINTSKKTVDLLKERRSALISAAVTGQIDVRGLVTQEETV